MRICEYCKMLNLDGALECHKCGAPLPVSNVDNWRELEDDLEYSCSTDSTDRLMNTARFGNLST